MSIECDLKHIAVHGESRYAVRPRSKLRDGEENHLRGLLENNCKEHRLPVQFRRENWDHPGFHELRANTWLFCSIAWEFCRSTCSRSCGGSGSLCVSPFILRELSHFGQEIRRMDRFRQNIEFVSLIPSTLQ